MRERPILFNGEMVRAILEGRKTQTRRVMKPQPCEWVEAVTYSEYQGCWTVHGYEGGMMTSTRTFDGQPELKCPYGKSNDELWVADGSPTPIDYWCWKRNTLPSIHMPRGVSRIQLKITDVRVERLQDITEDDAKAEGVHLPPIEEWWYIPDNPHILKFQELWDSINAKKGYGWDLNPWVWVVEFEVMQ